MKITVNKIPPSNNKFLGRGKDFHEYHNIKKEWEWLMRCAIKEKPNKPFKHAMVHIKYYFKTGHRRDPDNYSGKMILDPLKTFGIIEDDSFWKIELKLSAAVDKQNPRTEIYVEELK